MHGAAAGDEEDMAGAPVAQLAENVIGRLIICSFHAFFGGTGQPAPMVMTIGGWRGRLPMGICEYPRTPRGIEDEFKLTTSFVRLLQKRVIASR